jgi:hypothetical protein
MWHQEEEYAAEQNAKTYTHESSQSQIEGIIGYEPLASLTRRSAPMPPT